MSANPLKKFWTENGFAETDLMTVTTNYWYRGGGRRFRVTKVYLGSIGGHAYDNSYEILYDDEFLMTPEIETERAMLRMK